MNTKAQYRSTNQKVIDKLVLASPLMPAIFAVLLFIGVLSPLTWSVPGLFGKVFLASLGISIVSAYCIVSFMHDYDNQ
jgi:hypothetical protein